PAAGPLVRDRLLRRPLRRRAADAGPAVPQQLDVGRLRDRLRDAGLPRPGCFDLGATRRRSDDGLRTAPQAAAEGPVQRWRCLCWAFFPPVKPLLKVLFNAGAVPLEQAATAWVYTAIGGVVAPSHL